MAVGLLHAAHIRTNPAQRKAIWLDATALGELDDSGSVERVAQDILQKLAEPFHLGIETAYITASIGITLYPEDAADIDELLKNADQAMYAAKNQGPQPLQLLHPIHAGSGTGPDAAGQ